MINLRGGPNGLKSTFKSFFGGILRFVPGRRRASDALRDSFSSNCLARPRRVQPSILTAPNALLPPKTPQGTRATRAVPTQQSDLQRTQLACRKLLSGMLALHDAMRTPDAALQADLFLKLFQLQGQAKNFLELPQRQRRFNGRTPYAQSAAAAHYDQLLAYHCEAAEAFLDLYNASQDFVATAPAAFLTQQILLQQAIGSLLACAKQQGSSADNLALRAQCKPLLTALPFPTSKRHIAPADATDYDALFAAYEREAYAEPDSNSVPATLSENITLLLNQPDYKAELEAAKQRLTQAKVKALAVNDDLIAQLSPDTFSAPPSSPTTTMAQLTLDVLTRTKKHLENMPGQLEDTWQQFITQSTLTKAPTDNSNALYSPDIFFTPPSSPTASSTSQTSSTNSVSPQSSSATAATQFTPSEQACIDKYIEGVRGREFAGNIEEAILQELCSFKPDIYTTNIGATSNNENNIPPEVRNFFAEEVRRNYFPLYHPGTYNDPSQPHVALLNSGNNSHFELLVVQTIKHYQEYPRQIRAATGERINPQGQADHNCLYLAYVIGSKLQREEITPAQARTDRSFAEEAADLRQTVADTIELRLNSSEEKYNDYKKTALANIMHYA